MPTADFPADPTMAVIVEEHVTFTLTGLCRASGAHPDQVQTLVAEGLLQPTGDGLTHWRFSGSALPLTRRALRLAHDLDLGVAGAVLVIDLLAEIESLRSDLRRT